ncbi:MAG: phosphodiester glycosidase family protein [Deltaproteobacteria bacterium]|jgi:hypothetical protein|nr:phosphodiester glycosidase family protein [Deltaproteobacteria bacterium]
MTLLAGCLALAAGPEPEASDFPSDGRLRSQIWQLSAWLSPISKEEAEAASAEEGSAKLFRRKANLSPTGNQPLLEVELGYKNSFSVWPISLMVKCRPETTEVDIYITDSLPFGQENLKIEKIVENNKTISGYDNLKSLNMLEDCLAQAIKTFSLGPYFEPFSWQLLEPGLWRAKTQARYGPRLGSKEIILVKASPKYFRLAPYHELEKTAWKQAPGTIRAWAKRFPEAPILINGGQYYPDRGYMGSLRRKGQDIGGKVHPSFKGFWVQDPFEEAFQEPVGQVSEPEPLKGSSEGRSREGRSREGRSREGRSSEGQSREGRLEADLIDRELISPEDPGEADYQTVIQSYMVLDRLGRIRVKTSELLASRAVLGIDREGLPVALIVKGAITLSDLALLSKKLGLVSALGLDGGLETQLAFNTENGPEIDIGSYSNNFFGTFLVEDLSPSLPSVIVFERLRLKDSAQNLADHPPAE